MVKANYKYSVKIYKNLLPALEQEIRELGIENFEIYEPEKNIRKFRMIERGFVYFYNEEDFFLWKLSSTLLTPGWNCGIKIYKFPPNSNIDSKLINL